MEKNAFLEGTKELGRILLIAVLPILIDSFATGSFSWRVTGLALMVALLKALDKWIHENKDIKANGLVPF